MSLVDHCVECRSTCMNTPGNEWWDVMNLSVSWASSVQETLGVVYCPELSVEIARLLEQRGWRCAQVVTMEMPTLADPTNHCCLSHMPFTRMLSWHPETHWASNDNGCPIVWTLQQWNQQTLLNFHEWSLLNSIVNPATPLTMGVLGETDSLHLLAPRIYGCPVT